MDDELRKLQEQFAQVQMQETAHKLSERHCISILLHLMETKQIELVHTATGREYLTPKQLRDEVYDQIQAHGGRVGIVDLQPIINVDITKIEETVHRIVGSDRSMRLINGQVITDWYLDGIMEETNSALQDSGQISLVSLAQRFFLPADLIHETVLARMGTLIQGHFQDGQLYTDSFVQRHNSRVRGILSAITVPTTVRSLVAEFGLLESLTYGEIESLIDREIILGKLQGTKERSTFIPMNYSLNQQQSVDTFFSSNGYVEYSLLQRLQIAQPSKFLSAKFPGGLALKTCFIGEHVINSVMGSIEDACAQSTWVDVALLLPSPCTREDVAAVIKHVLALIAAQPADPDNAQNNTCSAFGSQFVVTSGFLAHCVDVCAPLAKAAAARASTGKPAEEPEAPADEDRKDKKKAKAKPQKEDEDTGKKGKKPSKKKGKKQDDDDEEEEDVKVSSKKSGGANSAGDASFSDAEIGGVLSKSIEDLSPELLPLLVDYVRPFLIKQYREAKASLLSGGATEKRRLQDEIRKQLAALYEHFQLFHHGVQFVLGEQPEPEVPKKGGKGKDKGKDKDKEDEKQDSKIGAGFGDEGTRRRLGAELQTHLIRTLGAELTGLLVQHEYVAYYVQTHGSADKLQLGPPPVARNDQMALVTPLPTDACKALTVLVNAITLKSSSEFKEAFDTVCAGACEINLKPLDKKKERALLFNVRRSIMALLEKDNNPREALLRTLLVLHSMASGVLLHAPGRASPLILESLQSRLVPDSYQLLSKFTALCKELVKQEQEREDGKESDEKVNQQLQEEVDKQLAAVKAIGLNPKQHLTGAVAAE